MQNNQPDIPDKNLQTYKKHQLQFYTQILLPLLIVAGSLITLGFLAAFKPTGALPNTATWAHISTMFIMLILIITGLGGLILLATGIYGIGWLNNRLPHYSWIAQIYTRWFSSRIQSAADKAVSPMVAIKSTWAAVGRIFKRKSTITIDEE